MGGSKGGFGLTNEDPTKVAGRIIKPLLNVCHETGSGAKSVAAQAADET